MFSPLLLGAAQRIETACYIGTIVDSMTWRQAKYPAPDRPFGRPGGHAGMRPRRGWLTLLRLRTGTFWGTRYVFKLPVPGHGMPIEDSCGLSSPGCGGRPHTKIYDSIYPGHLHHHNGFVYLRFPTVFSLASPQFFFDILGFAIRIYGNETVRAYYRRAQGYMDAALLPVYHHQPGGRPAGCGGSKGREKGAV